MLQQFRGALRNSKILTAFLAVLVIAAFAVVGIFDQNISFSGGAPLKVGDRTFSQSEIARTYRQRVEAQVRDSDGRLTEAQLREAGLLDSVIGQLALTATLDEDADDLGLGVTGAMVRDYVKDDLGIKNPITGELDRQTLAEVIGRARMSVEEFYEIVEGDLVRGLITQSLGASAPAPEVLATSFARRRAERRALEYLVLPPETAAIEEPTEEDLRARYERDLTVAYSTPARRRVAAVILDPETLAGDDVIDEETLRTIYDANAERYRTDETRSTHRITAPSEAAAQSAVAELRAGTITFEDLAVRFNRPVATIVFEDQTREAITDAAVAQAVFAGAEGDVLDPVIGLFGPVVVRIDEVTPAQTTPYEEMKDQIRDALLADRTREALYAALERVETERDSGASLREAAIAAEIELVEPAPFDGGGLTAEGDEVDFPVELAIEAFQLAEGEETAFQQLPESLGEGEYALQLLEIVEPQPIPFEEVREAVERAERAARVEAELRRLAGDIVANLSADDDGGLTVAAEPLGLTPSVRIADLNTTDAVFTRSLVNRVFNAEPNEPFIATVGDDVIIVVVRALIQPSTRELPVDQVARVRDLLGASITGELGDAYLAEAQRAIGVSQNRAKIEDAVGPVR